MELEPLPDLATLPDIELKQLIEDGRASGTAERLLPRSARQSKRTTKPPPSIARPCS